MEEPHSIVAVVDSYQVEPAMPFEGEFHAAFVDDGLAHVGFGDVGWEGRQSGTFTHYVDRASGVGCLTKFVECLGLHQQHASVAIDHEVGGAGVCFGGYFF